MLLYLIADRQLFKQIYHKEHYSSNKSFSGDYEYLAHCYDWMRKEMNGRLPVHEMESEFNSLKSPVWAWYQWNGEKQKRPNMRFYSNSQKEDLYLLTLEVSDERVLLSDYELWCWCLLDLYLPLIYNENENYSAYSVLAKESSWKNIFNLDLLITDINNSKKQIQACFWDLHWTDVKKVEYYPVRK